MLEATVMVLCVCMFVGNSEEVADMKFVSVNLNRLAIHPWAAVWQERHCITIKSEYTLLMCYLNSQFSALQIHPSCWLGQEDKSLCGECPLSIVGHYTAWLQLQCTILCCVPLQDVGAGQIHHIQKPIEAWSTATVSLTRTRQRRMKMFCLIHAVFALGKVTEML